MQCDAKEVLQICTDIQDVGSGSDAAAQTCVRVPTLELSGISWQLASSGPPALLRAGAGKRLGLLLHKIAQMPSMFIIMLFADDPGCVGAAGQALYAACTFAPRQASPRPAKVSTAITAPQP